LLFFLFVFFVFLVYQCLFGEIKIIITYNKIFNRLPVKYPVLLFKRSPQTRQQNWGKLPQLDPEKSHCRKLIMIYDAFSALL